VTSWVERDDRPRDRDLRVRGTTPVDCSDEEFRAALRRETDRSIAEDVRRYGEVRRWPWRTSTDGDRRPADRSESGVAAYRRDADRDTWDHLIDRGGRADHGYDARAAGRKSWATRRAREAATQPHTCDDATSAADG
jgi:hypothetical protein